MTQEINYLEEFGRMMFRFRKDKEMTQDQVAQQTGIQRSAYALIELGKRHVATRELFALSALYSFSIPVILSQIYGTTVNPADSAVIFEKRRMFNFQKFKSVLLYILQQCKDKPNIGKVVLNKLLYFSDFNYFYKYRDYLTGLRYSKLPMGPVPGIESFIEQMKINMEIKEVPVDYYGYPSIRYVPMVKPEMTCLLQQEIDVINEVLSNYAHLNATAISELSHDDPPWLETANIGDEIDYNLVFKRNVTI